jgi:hypothetical protein
MPFNGGGGPPVALSENHLTPDVSEASWPSTTRIVALALIGYLLALALLLLNVNGASASRTFFRQPETKVWMTVIAAQAGFWAVAASYVWPMARPYLPHGLKELKSSGPAIAMLLILLLGVPLAASFTAGNVNPLWGSGWKTPILSLAAFVAVAIPAFFGILDIWRQCNQRLGMRIEDEEIEVFLGLREDLNHFLGLLGTVIALAVLAAGLLRKAVLAANPGAEFPPEAILQYGAFLSLLLAFAYVPANHTLLRLGRKTRDQLLPPRPEPKDTAFRDWYGRRKDLGELLQIDATTFQRLQSGIFILSPLITAGLSLAIPKSQ